MVSRDGGLVAYVSTKNGRDELYVTTFPEKGPQLQVSDSGGRYPRWSQESLFFLSSENELMEVEIEAGSTVRLGEVRRVLSGLTVGVDLYSEAYDVSASSQCHACAEMIRSTGSGGS